MAGARQQLVTQFCTHKKEQIAFQVKNDPLIDHVFDIFPAEKINSFDLPCLPTISATCSLLGTGCWTRNKMD
jgi:hypothetical protein